MKYLGQDHYRPGFQPIFELVPGSAIQGGGGCGKCDYPDYDNDGFVIPTDTGLGHHGCGRFRAFIVQTRLAMSLHPPTSKKWIFDFWHLFPNAQRQQKHDVHYAADYKPLWVTLEALGEDHPSRIPKCPKSLEGI